MRHRFRRDDAELRVDPDLWLCVLDLALAQGWKPGQPDPPGVSYVQPRGQEVAARDARELARCFSLALPSIPDEVVPLSDHAFGDENTIELIGSAQQGSPPSEERVTAARELLSGPPKTEAAALAEFLGGGAFSIHSGQQ